MSVVGVRGRRFRRTRGQPPQCSTKGEFTHIVWSFVSLADFERDTSGRGFPSTTSETKSQSTRGRIECRSQSTASKPRRHGLICSDVPEPASGGRRRRTHGRGPAENCACNG